MGMSKGYGGPRTGLVPSWVDDPGGDAALASAPASAPDALVPAPTLPLPDSLGTSRPPNAPDTAPTLAPAFPDTAGAGSLAGARKSFSRFATTGSGRALGRAVSRYVRRGIGGGRRAARRMGAARAAGARLLSIVRDVERVGAAEALRHLNLAGLAGRQAADVFLVLTEVVCPPGGSVDEAIARQGMLEALAVFADAGFGAFDTLTPDQLQEFFLEFVIRTIEGRILADLGTRSITLPTDVAAVERAQQQLYDFVAGCTRGELATRLEKVQQLNDQEIERVVEDVYEAGFELLAAAGEAAV